MEQMLQAQQGKQQAQPKAPSLIKPITSGGVGNVANRIGGLFGQDWSTTAGNLGGGVEIGGAPTANLPATVGELFGGSTTVAPTTGLGSLGGLAGAGVGAGILGGTALVGKGAKDLLSGKDTKGWEGWGGRGSLALATGGLSEVARPFMGGKSTKDYQRERQQKVIDKGNTGWQDFFGKQPLGAKDPNDGKWTEGIGAGKKWNMDDAKERAKLNPAEFAGVQGNADTFGDDWFKLDDAKRDSLVKKFLDEDLYHSDKGSILISDGKQDRAKQLYNEIMGIK